MIGMAELDDRWAIFAEDVLVTGVCIDWSVRLVIGSAGAPLEIRIESPFLFVNSDGIRSELVPADDPQAIAPVLAAVRRPLERLDAFKDGRLEILIGDGISLSVPISNEFEPWEIGGPNGFRIVSLPGGGISVWSATAE